MPPPMAREIGHEIKKCMVWKNENESKNGNAEGRKEAAKENMEAKVAPSDCDSDVQMIE